MKLISDLTEKVYEVSGLYVVVNILPDFYKAWWKKENWNYIPLFTAQKANCSYNSFLKSVEEIVKRELC